VELVAQCRCRYDVVACSLTEWCAELQMRDRVRVMYGRNLHEHGSHVNT
jgi:hypothetical protein